MECPMCVISLSCPWNVSPDIPESDNALDIVQLCFSHDGQFLAVVSDLPTYQLHIFELRTGTVLCSSAVNDEPIDQVSFNPWNAKQLCTSGREGTVDFWELEAGYHKFSLRHL